MVPPSLCLFPVWHQEFATVWRLQPAMVPGLESRARRLSFSLVGVFTLLLVNIFMCVLTFFFLFFRFCWADDGNQWQERCFITHLRCGEAASFYCWHWRHLLVCSHDFQCVALQAPQKEKWSQQHIHWNPQRCVQIRWWKMYVYAHITKKINKVNICHLCRMIKENVWIIEVIEPWHFATALLILVALKNIFPAR